MSIGKVVEIPKIYGYLPYFIYGCTKRTMEHYRILETQYSLDPLPEDHWILNI